MTTSMIRCREKPAHVCGRGPLIEVELPRRCRAGTAGNDPKPTSDALRRSRHEANGAFPFGSGARLCAHRDPGGQSARDLILARRSFHGGQDAARPAHHALRFCRHQPRCRRRYVGRCDKAGVAVAAVMPAPGQCKFGGRFEGENGCRARGNGWPRPLSYRWARPSSRTATVRSAVSNPP